jgi:hypothetical protein
MFVCDDEGRKNCFIFRKEDPPDAVIPAILFVGHANATRGKEEYAGIIKYSQKNIHPS